MVELMSPGDMRANLIAPNNPDVVLEQVMGEFITKRGVLSRSSMVRMEKAAVHAPLDARPYLFRAVDDVLHQNSKQVVATLEAGRRLDGRQRWIRLFLLDQYLRAGRYPQAAEQLSVLSRLVTAAQAPILSQFAQMSQAPETRDAVRETLRRDPVLEVNVLTALAHANPDPALLFSIASPRARAAAGQPNGWGQALIEALVQKGRFVQARKSWLTLFGIGADQARQSVYNPQFGGARGTPPFNWAFASGSIGAAIPRNGQLNVDYYGREDGPLASQLLVLQPGRYRLTYTLAGSTGVGLSWTVNCADQRNGTPLASIAVPQAASALQRFMGVLTVPSQGCSAQWLQLVGTAAEFPTAVSATISDVALQPVGSPR